MCILSGDVAAHGVRIAHLEAENNQPEVDDPGGKKHSSIKIYSWQCHCIHDCTAVTGVCVCVCVCVWVRACVRACVRAYVYQRDLTLAIITTNVLLNLDF